MKWKTVRLSEICKVVSGATPKRNTPEYWNGSIKWVTPKDLSKINSKTLNDTPEKITELGYKSCSAKLLPKGSILFSSRAPIGHIAIVGNDMCTNQGFKSLIPAERMNSNFLYWCIKKATPEIVNMGRGATFKEISKSDMENVQIPFPPLAEQKRIAGILDKADEIRKKRQQAIKECDEFLKATFLDMFGDPRINLKGFKQGKLEQVAIKVTDGDHHTPKREESGIKLLSARNVLMGRICFKNTDFVGEAEYKRMIKRCEPLKGDILISCSGSIGRVACIDFDEKVVLVRSAALVKVNNDLIKSKFLEHYLRTDYLQQHMQRAANASSQANLFQGPIKNLPVLLPPLPLQEKFAKIVEKTETMKTRMQESAVELDDNFNNLMQRAFKGEL